MLVEPMDVDADESSVLSVVDVICERCIHKYLPCVSEGGAARMKWLWLR